MVAGGHVSERAPLRRLADADSQPQHRAHSGRGGGARAARPLRLGYRCSSRPLGFVVAAVWGWSALLAERHGKPHREATFKWGEALALAGLSASGLLLVQLERLVLPHLLPLSDLALYGVLGAIAGSLFRVLQMGVGFSLLPRLRAASGVVERRRLIAPRGPAGRGHRAGWDRPRSSWSRRSSSAGSCMGSITCRSVCSSRPSSAAWRSCRMPSPRVWRRPLVGPRELSVVNVAGWLSVGLALVGAYVGARWGLAGVIYGVGLGWFLRSIISFGVVVRHLRMPAGVPATAP